MLRLIYLLIFITISYALFAQDGETLFKTNCSACHKLGMRLIGPDLTNITKKRNKEWLYKFIRSSQTLIKSGDKEANKIFKEFNIIMPDQNLTTKEIDAILAYIESKSPKEKEEKNENPSETTNSKVSTEPSQKEEFSDEIIQKGANLFAGKLSFINKGPSCISCHNVKYDEIVSGGALAKDLSDAYERLGSAGIKGILSGLPFPAMKKSFENKKLTDDEINALTAFLKKVSEESIYQHTRNYGNTLLYSGITGSIILLCIFTFIWYNRKRKTVNYNIYKRQIKSL